MAVKKNRAEQKRARRRRYRKTMASLTGAALLSSAMLTGASAAKASESPRGTSVAGALGEAWSRSKEELQESVKDALLEKIGASIESLRKNPEFIGQLWEKSKDKLEAMAKEEIQQRVEKQRRVWEAEILERLAPRLNQQANRVVDVTATAYTSGPEDNGAWDDKTHIGTKVRPGVIAVDPKVIPLGSKVYVELADGAGMYAVAEDTGGAIKGNRIDIALGNRGEAKQFGIQDAKVHILEPGHLS